MRTFPWKPAGPAGWHSRSILKLNLVPVFWVQILNHLHQHHSSWSQSRTYRFSLSRSNNRCFRKPPRQVWNLLLFENHCAKEWNICLLNVCVPLKFICWNPKLMVLGAACRRSLGHEVGALRNELVPLYKRPQRACWPLLPCEVPRRRQLSMRKQALTRHNLSVPWTWTSQHPELRNTCCL